MPHECKDRLGHTAIRTQPTSKPLLNILFAFDRADTKLAGNRMSVAVQIIWLVREIQSVILMPWRGFGFFAQGPERVTWLVVMWNSNNNDGRWGHLDLPPYVPKKNNHATA